MKTKLALLAFGIAALAYGQDRTITVRPVDVDVQGLHMLILPDAGCSVQALARSTKPNVTIDTQRHTVNGTRCATMALIAERAAMLDIGVGDGGRP